VLTHDGSNRPTRIILAAMMLIVGILGPWFLLTHPQDIGLTIAGWAFVALFEAIGVWMWIRMPVIKPYAPAEQRPGFPPESKRPIQ
jgi:hypothetical protein